MEAQMGRGGRAQEWAGSWSLVGHLGARGRGQKWSWTAEEKAVAVVAFPVLDWWVVFSMENKRTEAVESDLVLDPPQPRAPHMKPS